MKKQTTPSARSSLSPELATWALPLVATGIAIIVLFIASYKLTIQKSYDELFIEVTTERAGDTARLGLPHCKIWLSTATLEEKHKYGDETQKAGVEDCIAAYTRVGSVTVADEARRRLYNKYLPCEPEKCWSMFKDRFGGYLSYISLASVGMGVHYAWQAYSMYMYTRGYPPMLQGQV